MRPNRSLPPDEFCLGGNVADCHPPGTNTPELQPAETLWALVDEPIVNQHVATIEELDAKIAHQCVALAEQREQIQSRTNFHWWPKPIIPN